MPACLGGGDLAGPAEGGVAFPALAGVGGSGVSALPIPSGGPGTCITAPFLPQVYDTPPMAIKGPNGWDPSLDVYDVPPSVEKSLPPSSHHAVSSTRGAGASLAGPD